VARNSLPWDPAFAITPLGEITSARITAGNIILTVLILIIALMNFFHLLYHLEF